MDGVQTADLTGVRLRRVPRLLENSPENDHPVSSNVLRTSKPDAGTETTASSKFRRANSGIFIRTDGSNSPVRFTIHCPCFHNLSALPEMVQGEYVVGLLASLDSPHIVRDSVDR
ncbi:hypothetical protein [Natronorubrum halalkaliphilum]|uniref:NADH-quinone oxidoreductase subunit D-related protein n=1 Tax=Natronorubrum halalkaliphilum TaxID=2691917 RepID=UPI002E2AF08E|nr:hypothetical protein [Natronorubrum halalkaliphilum]